MHNIFSYCLSTFIRILLVTKPKNNLSFRVKFVELASHEVAVYNYKYTHRSNLTLTTTYGLPDNHFAPTHADELLLMFNSTFQEVKRAMT